MSSSEEDNNGRMSENDGSHRPSISEPDDNTLRVLISTDNHLGYCETDPVRGLDSFAAFEEVLYLAKLHKVDMVLLGGDLFHHNKPSRRTLHKTMEILRRYCMGPNPVKIQILSDQQKDFRQPTVNYEDENYSVDLPIFSIHGNHDDPTREGGGETLAALDLLSVSNLINYFGRNTKIEDVEISPVLIQKGTTRVALYGLGNMRDERLNRMWQQKKVRFLRPERTQNRVEDDDEEEEEEEEKDDNNPDWFNIFVLHQNRDNTGRGTKNCIHESMIPNWVDLTVFGHEHCSEPFPVESVVGTFRITQPGSSVATSLTEGEAARKHCVILNVRGAQFRLDPIPLTMVRAFVMHDVALADEVGLKEDDVKVDGKISHFLEEQLETWIYNAQQKDKALLKEAKETGNYAALDNSGLKYRLERRKEVLVRLRVDHGKFLTMNNQRFGARFVGRVANPSDILLFQKSKRKPVVGGGRSKKSKVSDLLDDPVAPAELDEHTSVAVLVKQNIDLEDQKLSILTEKNLADALEDFVEKENPGAIVEKTNAIVKKRQKELMKSTDASKGDDVDGWGGGAGKALDKQSQADDNGAKMTTNPKRSSCRDIEENDDDFDEDMEEGEGTENVKSKMRSQSKRTSSASLSDSDNSDEVVVTSDRNKSKTANKENSTRYRSSAGSDIRSFQSKSSQKSQSSKKRKSHDYEDEDDFDDQDELGIVAIKRSSASKRRTARGKVNYAVDIDASEEEEDSGGLGDSLAPKKVSHKAFTSSSRRKERKGKSQVDDSFDLDADWGSASTKTQP